MDEVTTLRPYKSGPLLCTAEGAGAAGLGFDDGGGREA
jgi:hypothetical protein